MAVDDVYVIKMKQIANAQEMLNQFFYAVSVDEGSDGAKELFDEFNTDILADWVDCVQDDQKVTSLEVFNIGVPTKFWEALPTNNTGTRAATNATRVPTWTSFGYRSNRNGAGTRRSYKRFAGLLEVDIDYNTLSAAFLAIPEVDALRNTLGTKLVGVSGGEFLPVQISAGWVPGVTPVINFGLTSWQDPVLTSQVSRKP